MSDSIIPLPDNGILQRERYDRWRIQAIKNKIEDKDKRQMRPSDRIIVAENLWRILYRLENGQPQVRKTTIAQEVWKGDKVDSTKRFYRFAIDPELSEEKKQILGKKLTQKIALYKRIVQVAATLGGLDVDNITFDLVERSSFDVTQPEQSDTDDVIAEAWQDIELVVARISSSIATKYDLDEVFRRIIDYGIVQDHLDRLTSSKQGRGTLYRGLQATTLPALIPTNDLPPCPSVFLGEVKGYQDVPCTIRFSAVEGVGDLGGQLFSRIVDEGLETVEIDGTARPAMRYHLDLLPIGHSGAIKAVLRVESKTYVVAGENFSDYTSFGGVPIRRGQTVGVIFGPLEDGQNFIDNCEIPGEDPVNTAAYDEKSDSGVNLSCEIECDTSDFPTYENSVFARAAANHSCLVPLDERARAYLDTEVVTDLIVGGAHYGRYCLATAAALPEKYSISGFPDEGFTVFGSDSMAAALERSLLEAPPEARLDRILDESARSLADRLNEKLEKLKARRAKILSDILREYPS